MFLNFEPKSQITELYLDLRTFGLNPTDWNILREKSQIYRVQSKEDQNFIFLGKATQKGRNLKWKKLELVSL